MVLIADPKTHFLSLQVDETAARPELVGAHNTLSGPACTYSYRINPTSQGHRHLRLTSRIFSDPTPQHFQTGLARRCSSGIGRRNATG